MGDQRVFWGALIVFVLVLMVGGITLAAQLTDEVDWWVVAGGGGSSGGGSYSLRGSVGQSGTGIMTGGVYSLQSGFWRRAATAPTPTSTPTSAETQTSTPTGQNDNSLYLPIIVRD